MNRYVDICLAGGWQEEVPAGFRHTYHFTSGVKLVLLRDTVVQPYVLGGVGMMHFRVPEPLNGKNRFLTEVGAGVAFRVGAQGYIDVGYRYLTPYRRSAQFHAEWRVRRVRPSVLTPATHQRLESDPRPDPVTLPTAGTLPSVTEAPPLRTGGRIALCATFAKQRRHTLGAR